MFIRSFQKDYRTIFNSIWYRSRSCIIFTFMALGNNSSRGNDDIWIYLAILLGGILMRIVVLKPKGFIRFVLKKMFKI